MDKITKKTILVTGASSGIGKACASYFLRKGYNVIGASRSVDENDSSNNIKYIKMDVTDEASVKEAFDKIDNLDVLILSHGMGIAGAGEIMPLELSKRQMDVNYFGALNVTKYALPIMRKNKKGLIIAISSVAGRLVIPMQSHYSSSKFALEAYIESLRIELKDFNIKTSIIEPGDTKTGFTDSRNIYNPEDSIYHDVCDRSIKKMEHDERNGKDPISVAEVAYKISKRKNPPIRVAVGFEYKLICFLNKILPSRFVDYILSKMYMPKEKKGHKNHE